MIDCCIFDLDGVVVDTARYHYLAWAALARELGFEFTPVQGEATKGVSRMASLEIVLRAGGLEGRFSAAERDNSILPASRCKIFGSGLSSKNQPRVPATAYPSHTAQLLKIKSTELNLLSSKNSLNFFEVLHHRS